MEEIVSDKKQLLTEESIGRVFDCYRNDNLKGTLEIAIKNKNGFWQGYWTEASELGLEPDEEDYICSALFDKYGQKLEDAAVQLKPQRKKIDLLDWLKEDQCRSVELLLVNKSNLMAQFCQSSKVKATIPIEKFYDRIIETDGNSYFYEGEGLDEEVCVPAMWKAED